MKPNCCFYNNDTLKQWDILYGVINKWQVIITFGVLTPLNIYNKEMETIAANHNEVREEN